MSDRQTIVLEIQKCFSGSVRASNDILYALVERGHFQAAVDILPYAKQSMTGFEQQLQESLTAIAAQDEYRAFQRRDQELQAVADAANLERLAAEEKADVPVKEA